MIGIMILTGNKGLWWLIGVLILLVVVCGVIFRPGIFKAKPGNVAGHAPASIPGAEKVCDINGEPVTWEEFQLRMNMNRAMIFDYFKKKYNVDYGAGFWTGNHEGEVPLAKIKEQTVQDLVRIKVQQVMARDYGVVRDISFGAFKTNLAEENKRREEAVRNKEVIYGPQQYDMQTYYDYIFSNMVIKLKEEVRDRLLKPTDQDLERFYDTVKEELYKLPDEIRLQKISLTYTGAGRAAADQKEQARKFLEDLREKLLQGGNLARLLQTKAPEGWTLKSADLVFDQNSARYATRMEPELVERAQQLGLNQLSDVFEEQSALAPSSGSLVMIKCLTKKSGGFKPFAEFKDSVQMTYVTRKYEELIARLVAKAEVKIVAETYRKITEDYL